MRVGRIELPSRPWQGRILPLNHTRPHTNTKQSFCAFPFQAFRCFVSLFRPCPKLVWGPASQESCPAIVHIIAPRVMYVYTCAHEYFLWTYSQWFMASLSHAESLHSIQFHMQFPTRCFIASTTFSPQSRSTTPFRISRTSNSVRKNNDVSVGFTIRARNNIETYRVWILPRNIPSTPDLLYGISNLCAGKNFQFSVSVCSATYIF